MMGIHSALPSDDVTRLPLDRNTLLMVRRLIAEHVLPQLPRIALQQVHAAAAENQSAPENAIIVPDERPEKLHRIAAAVEKALRKAKPDGHGFLNVEDKGLPE